MYSANVSARGAAATALRAFGRAGANSGVSHIVEGIETGNYGQASYGVGEVALSLAGLKAAYDIAPRITVEPRGRSQDMPPPSMEARTSANIEEGPAGGSVTVPMRGTGGGLDGSAVSMSEPRLAAEVQETLRARAWQDYIGKVEAIGGG